MLTAEARSRLAVVLVGARNPQNIGAAARAMHDFGFRDLRVVNEFAPPFEAAQLEAKSAVAAEGVMRSAKLFATLKDALADCTLIAGTTAIGGRGLTQPVLTLQSAADPVRTALDQSPDARPESAPPAPVAATETEAESSQPNPRVALLFGSEKTGLTNEQLSHCSLLLTIPMHAPEGRHLAMNLGQAVAVCLYELVREGFQGARDLPFTQPVPATSGDRERLLTLLLETMQRSDYARRFPANARPDVVRQLVHHLATTSAEAATWMGLFRLLLRALPPSLQQEV